MNLTDQLNRALALVQQGSLLQADAICTQVLLSRPREFHALHLRGIVAWQSQDLATAERWFRSAVAADASHPAKAAAHSNLAAVLLGLGRTQDALESAERALRGVAGHPEGSLNRAHALAALERWEDALVAYEQVLSHSPAHVLALCSRANVLLNLRRYEAAIDGFDRVLALEPNHLDALNNRGSALRRAGRHEEAIASYEQALRSQPDGADVWSNLANVWLGLGRRDEALRCCDRALALNAGLPDALNIRATLLRDADDKDAAAAAYDLLLKSMPAFDYALGNALFAKAQIADWSDRETSVRRIVEAIAGQRRACLPFSFLSLSESSAAQLRCAQIFVADRCTVPAKPRPARPTRTGPIRVAYVSGDFAEHPVSYLMAGLFERHDQSRCTTYGISLRPEQPSATGQRVKRAFAHFIDVSRRSDRQVSELLAELKIDIAVDLVGYTAGMRPQIFANRAAPIQISYLGFPGTMAAPFIDYLIADRFVVPEEAERHYGERMVLMPDCFQCFDDSRPRTALRPSRVSAGLPASGLVLCCFNNSYKLNPVLFDIWMRLLQRSPDGVLWLLGDRESIRANLRSAAAQRGVDPQRLIFAERYPYDAHLARLPLADLFLDTLPFNAGTTASDALSMGVPVLTTAGDAFASRMAGSLLTALGLPELVTQSVEQYESRATELVCGGGELHLLRQRLDVARRAAPVFDTDRFRRHLETAYEMIWDRHCRGEPPASVAVPRCTD